MKKFLIAYTILSLVVIVVKLLQLDQAETFLKPLLMPLLILFYTISRKPFTLYDYKIILALAFSTLGDVLLMPIFNSFMGGIMGFLVAHIFYISAFSSEKKTKLKNLKLWKKIIFGAGLLCYISLLYLLIPQLSTALLKIAITIYASILLVLLIVSLLRDPINSKSSDYIVLGAFLFLLSDGMIAINKFLIEIPVSALLIMGTYTSAQAFLVIGSLLRNK